MRPRKPPLFVSREDLEKLSNPENTRTQWGPWKLHKLVGASLHANKGKGSISLREGPHGEPVHTHILGELLRLSSHWPYKDSPHDLGMLVLAIRSILGFTGAETNWARWVALDGKAVEQIITERRRLSELAETLEKAGVRHKPKKRNRLYSATTEWRASPESIDAPLRDRVT
jgi:hypothetical protein